MHRLLSLLSLLAVLGGCIPQDFIDPNGEPTKPLPLSPFGNSPTAQTGAVQARSNYQPASLGLSLKVDQVGSKIMAANKQIGITPLYFASIGAPEPELFHVGDKMVYITEGLAKRCKTDGEMAALLCLELGKMVSEREARAPQEARRPERRPPMEVPMGNAGQFMDSDSVHRAEMARHENERPRAGKRVPPPDPMKLARTYLEKAGYKESDLEAAAPHLQEAERNFSMEKQLKSQTPQVEWKTP